MPAWLILAPYVRWRKRGSHPAEAAAPPCRPSGDKFSAAVRGIFEPKRLRRVALTIPGGRERVSAAKYRPAPDVARVLAQWHPDRECARDNNNRHRPSALQRPGRQAAHPGGAEASRQRRGFARLSGIAVREGGARQDREPARADRLAQGPRPLRADAGGLVRIGPDPPVRGRLNDARHHGRSDLGRSRARGVLVHRRCRPRARCPALGRCRRAGASRHAVGASDHRNRERRGAQGGGLEFRRSAAPVEPEPTTVEHEPSPEQLAEAAAKAKQAAAKKARQRAVAKRKREEAARAWAGDPWRTRQAEYSGHGVYGGGYGGQNSWFAYR